MIRPYFIIFLCISMTTSQRPANTVSRERGPDDHEIQRQNRITAQIVANYLERKLFPYKRPSNQLPTIDEILPSSSVQEPKKITRHTHQHTTANDKNPLKVKVPFTDDYSNDEDEQDPENLQSVESNHVDSYYEDVNDSAQEFACAEESTQAGNRWTMPLAKIGDKRYYVGTFFKANWFKAAQYCRFHGMNLASVSSQEENDRLEKHINAIGLGNEHFWTSGTDLADEGNFFWMANGRPITFTNWNAGEPNNFRYENGEEENCLELWNRDSKGLKWNDSPCSFETYFVCEV